MIEQAKRGMVAALNCIFSFAYALTQQSVLEQIAKNSVYNWNIGNQGDEVFSLISQLFQVEPVVAFLVNTNRLGSVVSILKQNVSSSARMSDICLWNLISRTIFNPASHSAEYGRYIGNNRI